MKKVKKYLKQLQMKIIGFLLKIALIFLYFFGFGITYFCYKIKSFIIFFNKKNSESFWIDIEENSQNFTDWYKQS